MSKYKLYQVITNKCKPTVYRAIETLLKKKKT